MEEHRRTELTRSGLRVRSADGGVDDVDLLSGEMHYWRVDRSQWRECLRAMKSIGLRVVSTYVPWSVHERAPGDFDWSGDRDLGAFLDGVAREGMIALVRPGPHINAELTGFGFPQRILDDDDIRARSARGTPVWLPAPPRMFAVPSYASTAFQREVAAWYAEIATVVAPRLAPDGPVAAIQVDNEHQLFFRLGAYDHDYHPDALAWWRELAGDVEPPRAWLPDDPGLCASWVGFKEQYTARALRWMADALDDVGLGDVARYHNFPPSEPALAPVPAAERAIDGPVGLDFYHRAKDQDTYWRRALYLAGTASRLPMGLEVGAGGPPWLLPMSERDQHSVILGLLGAGLRALNFYMAVDRERWYGAPIGDDGEVRPFGRWIERLLRAVDALDLLRLRRTAPLAVVVSRADARYAIASSLLDPLTPVVTELVGLADAASRDDDAREHRRWLAAIFDALDDARVPYALVDEGCSTERLCSFDALVMPTIHRVDAGLWSRLDAIAESGTRVVIGPGRPKTDERGAPLAHPEVPKGIGRLQRSSIDHPDDLADDLAALVDGAPTSWIAGDPRTARCALFTDAGGAPRALFVANRTGAQLSADVIIAGGASLRDALDGKPIAVDGDRARVRLAPHEVRMLHIDDDD